jgi:hypothetical protein
VKRLIPKREEKLVMATKTIYLSASNSLKPFIARGEVVPRDNPRVKQHPEAFEDAPTGTWRGLSPKPNEAVSIARTTFVATDGKWVWQGQRFYPHDGVVRAQPQFFVTELPRD